MASSSGGASTPGRRWLQACRRRPCSRSLRSRPTAEIFTALGQTASAQPATINAETAETLFSASSASSALNVVSASRVVSDSKATTIDALFGPLAEVQTEGRVWTYENNQL